MLTYEQLMAAQAAGRTVYTTAKPGRPDSGWTPEANRTACQWGQPVRILSVHTGHGLCAVVRHRDGTECSYNDDELQAEQRVDNPNLAAALTAGEAARKEKLAARDEQIIEARKARYLLDDWIYKAITYSIGEGKDHLELYDAAFEDDAESARWSAAAISRIPGLSAVIETYDSMRRIGQVDKLYYLHITWN